MKLLACLLLCVGCSSPPVEHTARSVPRLPAAAPATKPAKLLPGARPALLPPPPVLRACDTCYFSAALDQRIAATTCDPYAPLRTGEEEAADPRRRSTAWSEWQTDYCQLRDYVGEPDTTRYRRPLAIPNRANRRLFLAGGGPGQPVQLVEFDAAARFRCVWLGLQSPQGFGGDARHQLYYYPDAELLVLQSVEGSMGSGRGASGSANTWLQILDITQDKWLVSTPIGWYATSFGYDDEEGTEHVGGEQTVTRRWRLRDNGRTLWLGGYQVDGRLHDDEDGLGSYRTASMTQRLRAVIGEDSTLNRYLLKSGTYRLLSGQYQRVK